MNFTINSKKYHHLTKQGICDRKSKLEIEVTALNMHRLTIMKKGIVVHTTKKYSRIRFDKHIGSNRVSDEIAALLVNFWNLLFFIFLVYLNEIISFFSL